MKIKVQRKGRLIIAQLDMIRLTSAGQRISVVLLDVRRDCYAVILHHNPKRRYRRHVGPIDIGDGERHFNIFGYVELAKWSV